MRQVSPQQAKLAMERAFQTWGLPHRIRLDNGRPFANTVDRTLPTALVVWLVALGVEVIFNQVYSPQQNGTVECTQRISKAWANPKKCESADQLQKALNQVVEDHLKVYRIRRKADQTRQQIYPELFQNDRLYRPQQIDPNKAIQYLSQFEWARKVYSNGRINLFGHNLRIGKKYRHHRVAIRLESDSCQWLVFNHNGQVITSLGKFKPLLKDIADLTIFSKNFTT